MTATVGDFMVVRGGTVKPSQFPDEQFELYSIPAHDKGGPEILLGSEIGSAKQVVRPGDVMISKIIPHIRRVRVVGVGSGRRQIASGEWIVLRVDGADPNYVRHYLLSDRFHRMFMATIAGVGGSLVRARPTQVRSISMPIPELDEQRRIAAILDQADAVRTKRRKILAHLDDLTQAIFKDMFAETTATEPLGALADTRLGKMLDAKHQTGRDPRPYLRNANVQWFRFDLSNVLEMDFASVERGQMSLRPGDVLVCEGGEPGRAAVWQGEISECYFQKALHRVRLGSDLLPVYFVHAMRRIADSGGLKDFVTTSTISHLTGEKFRRLPIPVPPLSAQRLFVERAAGVDILRTAVESALAADNELFSSIQSRAFKGEL